MHFQPLAKPYIDSFWTVADALLPCIRGLTGTICLQVSRITNRYFLIGIFIYSSFTPA